MRNAETRKGILYTSLSLCVIFAFTYIVGRSLLTSFPLGSDTPNHLAKIYYLDRYFPHIPLWYYKEGCGYPFLMLYPPISYYIPLFLHRIFSISIFDSFNLTWFASVLFTALGIYFFVKVKYRNELMAVSSSIFYLSCPAIWLLETLPGFYSQVVAIPFFVFTLLFFTLYQDSRRKRYFLATILCYTFSILTHLGVGLITAIVLIVYALMRFFSKELSLTKAIIDTLKVGLTSLCLSSFWFIPFLKSNPFISLRMIREPIDLGYFLKLLPAVLGVSEQGNILGYSSYSIFLYILALTGTIFAIKQRRFSFWMMSLGIIFNAFLLEFLFFQSKTYPDTILRFNFPIIIFISILGGLGVLVIQKTLKSLIQKRRHIRIESNRLNSTTVVSFVLIILVFYFSLNHIYINPSSWGGFSIHTFSHEGTYILTKEISAQIDGNNLTRIDTSPNLGGIMETLTIISNLSQINTYFYQGNLIREWWGYQGGVFYGIIGGKTELRVLSRWFGPQYIIVSDIDDPIWKYQDNGFVDAWRSGHIRLLRHINATNLVSVGDVPTVLVISSEEHNAYEPIFRTIIMSGLDSEYAYIIHGGSYIDDYSLDELQKFDVLILHGYNYHDSNTAWELLRDYVFNGGGLFIETGWQYVNPDWSNPNIPMPCPVSMTFWTNYGKEWHFSHIDTPITKEPDFTTFSQPVWGESPWSFSTTNNESVRNWAQTVLWNKGHPIVVTGNYGEGRVVWSGMNLIPHAYRNNNYEECRFFAEMIRWMINRGTTKSDYEVTRPIPEKVVVSIHSTNEVRSVLFREAYYHKWHAYLEKGDTRIELEIYRAGPDLMLVKIPAGVNSPFKVVFEYRRSWIDWASVTVSVTTLCTLGIYAFLPQALYVIYYPFRKFKKRVKDWWHEE